MKDLFIVISYTMKEMLKKKTFLISNLIIIIIMVVGFNVPRFLNKNNETSNTNEGKILIVDEQRIFEGTLNKMNQMDLGNLFEITETSIEFSEIKEKMENDEIQNAIVIKKQDNKINIEYIVENLTTTYAIPESYVNALENIYSDLQLTKLGLTEEQLATAEPNFNFELKQTETQEIKGNIVAIMLLSLVLFYAIYFCAYQVSTSITVEKTSKIMETLVTSTTPRTIVIGKTIGIGIVGLIQVAVLVSIALICAYFFLPEGMLESVIDLSQMTPFLAIMTVIYFLLGYLVYALLYALTGSTVSKPEDVQSANGPVAIVAVIGFYLAYFTMMNPTSELNVFASIFPFSSPFCMPFRIMMGVATTGQIALSLIILLVAIIVVAQISIKIYSNAILNYGSRMGLKEIIQAYKNKND